MILTNKNIFTLFIFSGLLFYQPLPSSEGQSVDSNIPVKIQMLNLRDSENTESKIDTVRHTYNKFSNLVDKTKSNVKIATKQSTKLNEQAKELEAQSKVIDSLENVSNNSNKKEGKSIKNWKIFHIFDKKS